MEGAIGIYALVLPLKQENTPNMVRSIKLSVASTVADCWTDHWIGIFCPQTWPTLPWIPIKFRGYLPPKWAKFYTGIAKCEKSYANCQTFLSNSPLPTRVLDVQNIDFIRFWETHGQKGQYLALSHCWGQSKAFLTTGSNLIDMKNGFPSRCFSTLLEMQLLSLVAWAIDTYASICLVWFNEIRKTRPTSIPKWETYALTFSWPWPRRTQ